MRIAPHSGLFRPVVPVPGGSLTPVPIRQLPEPPADKPPVSVKQRLTQAWQHGRFAPIKDRELPAGIDTLMAYHVDVGFYGVRMDDMSRHGGYGPNGEIEVALAPNRKKVPIARDADGHGNCGLCNPPFPKERGMSWRGWRVWPNAFPYVPAASQHILLTSATHRAQGFAPDVLADMLDFQAAADGARPMTMHYNGIAGNSQLHLHWQATREVTPLQRQLDAGLLKLTPKIESGDGQVATYDQGFFCGILVSGNKPFVVRWASRIVERLNADPTTRGAYNMVLVPIRGGRFRLSIVPRRADNLRPVVGSMGPCGVGAFNTAGILVLPRATIPQDLNEALTPAVRSTIVPANELPWIDTLDRLPNAQLPGACF